MEHAARIAETVALLKTAPSANCLSLLFADVPKDIRDEVRAAYHVSIGLTGGNGGGK